MDLEKIKLAISKRPNLIQLFKGFLTVYTGRILGMGMTIIATIIVARMLGPHNYGLFSIFLTVMAIMPFFFGRSLDVGVVKFYSKNSVKNPDHALAIMSVALRLRIIVSICGSAAGYLLSNLIANLLFHNPELVFPLKMAFLGAFGMSLWYFSLAIFQAHEDFAKYAANEVIFALLRVVLIVGLILVGKMTLVNTLLVFMVIVYLSMFLSIVILPKGVFGGSSIDKKVGWELVGFCKWIFLFDVLYIIYNKQDILILSYLKDPVSVGLYSVAFVMLVPIEYLAGVLNAVQLPTVSKLSLRSEYKKYIKRTLVVSSILSILVIPFFFLAKPIMYILFSGNYSQAVVIYQILFFGFVIRMFTHPIYLLLISTDRPKILATIFGSVLVLNLFGNLLFVPTYGVIGAAWVTLVSRIIEGVLICLSTYNFVLLKNPKMLPEIKAHETKFIG